MESFLPEIRLKAPHLGVFPPNENVETIHPFEEKMKQVFTGGKQSMGDLTISQPARPTLAERGPSHDLYRESIE